MGRLQQLLAAPLDHHCAPTPRPVHAGCRLCRAQATLLLSISRGSDTVSQGAFCQLDERMPM